MKSLQLFVYSTDPNLLCSFFNHVSSKSFLDIDWGGSPNRLMLSLEETIGALPPDVIFDIQHALERIQRMSCDYAQQCMLKMVRKKDHFLTLGSSSERSCWLYLYENDKFSSAEAACLNHPLFFNKRGGHFLVNSNRPVIEIAEASLSRYCEEFLTKMGNETAYAKGYFSKPISTLSDIQNHRLHIDFYFSELNEKQMEIQGDEFQVESINRVTHYTIVYDSYEGTIDVNAPEKPRQAFLAHLFAHIFLDKEEVVCRPLSLMPFMSRQPLPINESDGIESIFINRLGFKNTEREHIQYIDFPPGSNSQSDVQTHIEASFGINNGVLSDVLIPIEVIFSIDFYTNDQASNRMRLPVKLSLPNQTNLSIFTERERFIVEKCLRKWSIMDVLDEWK